MPMKLDQNGYNSVFRDFAKFVQDRMNANDGKAIANARYNAIDGRSIFAVTDSSTDYVHKWSRSADETTINNRTCDLFKSSIVDMFGGENRIPASVRKAMVLGDYNCGKPLTARRIMAVKAAIDDVSKKALIANLPETMSIKAGGEVFKFDKWHYERMVKATPPAECPRTLSALKKHIAARIEHGQAIIRDVRAGRGDLHAATPRTSPTSRWRCTRRDSGTATNCRMDRFPSPIRTADSRSGWILRTTCTFPDLASLDAGGDGCGPSRRLFLKPETWGVRRNPIWSSTVADSLSEGMSKRKTRFSDWYESTIRKDIGDKSGRSENRLGNEIMIEAEDLP